MTKNQKIAFQILFFVYVAGLLLLCFGQFDDVPSVTWSFLGIPSDKLAHFCMFFPFPILAFLAFDQYTDNVRKTLIFVGVTLAVGVLLAVGTEWGQAHLTDYRSGEGLDLLADVIGLILGSVLVTVWDIYKQKK